MNNISNLEKCCGCGECANICPKDAITLTQNYQGFYYPNIDQELCINCGKCIEHCTFNSQDVNRISQKQYYYAAKHRDFDIRMRSRSGGVFTALSDYVLERNGVVYGCELKNLNTAIHSRATIKPERDKFRGSKYIQSNIAKIFDSVRNDVQSGKLVLFSGTACQCSAIKNYCDDIKHSNLITVDIVCHGVPSPKIWQDYIKYIEKSLRKKVKKVDFRNKKDFGWEEHIESFYFNDGTKYDSKLFRKMFYSHYILRKDCFSCPYKNIHRVGDISLADCWGVKENLPDFDDNCGVSLIIINSQIGKNIFDAILPSIECLSVKIEDYLQPPLERNWAMPDRYNEFWETYKNKTFIELLTLFFPTNLIIPEGKIKRLAKKIIKKIQEL